MLLGEIPAIQKLQKINMDKSLYKLKLVERIHSAANVNSLLGFAIVHAINEKKSDNHVLSFIQSQARDNPEVMGLVIGADLTKEIINLNL